MLASTLAGHLQWPVDPFSQVFPWIKPLVTPLNTRGTGAAQKTLIKVFIHKSFLEKRFHAPLWFQYIAVTREHHTPKFCHAWKSFFHARYLVDNFHVFQSGLYISVIHTTKKKKKGKQQTYMKNWEKCRWRIKSCTGAHPGGLFGCHGRPPGTAGTQH